MTRIIDANFARRTKITGKPANTIVRGGPVIGGADLAAAVASASAAQAAAVAAANSVSSSAATISTHTTQIAGLGTRLNAAEPQLVSLDSRLDTAEPQIAGLQSSDTAQNTHLTSIDAQQAAQDSLIAGLKLLIKLVTSTTSGVAVALVDALNRILIGVEDDGTLIAKLPIALGYANGLHFDRGTDGRYTLSLGDALGRIPVGGTTLDPSVTTTDRDLLAFVSAATGRMAVLIGQDGITRGRFADWNDSPMLTAATGVAVARMDKAFSAYGLPKDPLFNRATLRKAIYKARDRMTGRADQLSMAVIGDSWSNNPAYYLQDLTNRMIAAYGDAGPGWTGFSYSSLVRGNARANLVAVTVPSVDWAQNYFTSTISPDIGEVYSSTVGATITTVYSGSANLSAVKVYSGPAGSWRYRWNGGAWTTVTPGGTGLQITSLAGVPTGGWTLEVQVLSGTVTFCGLDLQATASGVRMHKLAASGTYSAQWSAVSRTPWCSAVANLSVDTFIYLHGTNDQANTTPAAMRTAVLEMIGRMRQAAPGCDILLVSPPENAAGLATPMTQYAEQFRQLAYENFCAHLDLQQWFGEAVADYAYGSTRPMLDSSLIHPNPYLGGMAVAAAIEDAFRI